MKMSQNNDYFYTYIFCLDAHTLSISYRLIGTSTNI